MQKINMNCSLYIFNLLSRHVTLNIVTEHITIINCSIETGIVPDNLTLLHSEWPKLHRVLAILSGIGLNKKRTTCPNIHL